MVSNQSTEVCPVLRMFLMWTSMKLTDNHPQYGLPKMFGKLASVDDPVFVYHKEVKDIEFFFVRLMDFRIADCFVSQIQVKPPMAISSLHPLFLLTASPASVPLVPAMKRAWEGNHPLLFQDLYAITDFRTRGQYNDNCIFLIFFDFIDQIESFAIGKSQIKQNKIIGIDRDVF